MNRHVAAALAVIVMSAAPAAAQLREWPFERPPQPLPAGRELGAESYRVRRAAAWSGGPR